MKKNFIIPILAVALSTNFLMACSDSNVNNESKQVETLESETIDSSLKEIENCMSDVKMALQARWAVLDNKDVDTIKENAELIQKAIDTELEHIKKYEDTQLSDETLSTTMSKFIKAVNYSCLKTRAS